jgi:hypothetical protein
MASDAPKFRPLERFWPYAELPEQPTDEELAALDPDLQDALFGPRERPSRSPWSFPSSTDGLSARAGARAARQISAKPAQGPSQRFRARFPSSDAGSLRSLFQIVRR